MNNTSKVVVVGGGTIHHVSPHFAICAPAYGTTAKKIASIFKSKNYDTHLFLTKMADSNSKIETNDDLCALAERTISDSSVKIVFWNPAVCDWKTLNAEGKYGKRLSTKEGSRDITIVPDDKIVNNIRKNRKDIFLVSFKTTSGFTKEKMYIAGLEMMKNSSSNLVLVNDVRTRYNMIVTPEESYYHYNTERDYVIENLAEMAILRSKLTFTRSTVIDSDTVKWDSNEIPAVLREVVNYCVENKAYKPFNGKTVGHFACKVGHNEFLTSIRRSNFNRLDSLVRVKASGRDSVIAYGAKPSVGGQSQRIIFDEHDGYDCIVHFHCPMNVGSSVPVASQREYECGSHECGQNTSQNLKEFIVGETKLKAVMLDNHGPNIVFSKDARAKDVIDFINNNFSLSDKTGGTYGFAN